MSAPLVPVEGPKEHTVHRYPIDDLLDALKEAGVTWGDRAGVEAKVAEKFVLMRTEHVTAIATLVGEVVDHYSTEFCVSPGEVDAGLVAAVGLRRMKRRARQGDGVLVLSVGDFR